MKDETPMALVFGTLPIVVAFLNSPSWDFGGYYG
jgi:hypothetical protein